MSAFSETLVARSGYERDGFADVYDAYRPTPAVALLDILQLVAEVERPRLVVDLGAGTGLSTRVWAERADEVVGVEANPQHARASPSSTSRGRERSLRRGLRRRDRPFQRPTPTSSPVPRPFTGWSPRQCSPRRRACSAPGGVFAAYDYDVPPVVQPEVDAAFPPPSSPRGGPPASGDVLEAGAASSAKERHVDQIRASGQFRFARELVCHGFDETSAERVVGLAESIGGPCSLFAGDAPEVDESFARLREVAHSVLGDRAWPMVVCYRIRVGVK